MGFMSPGESTRPTTVPPHRCSPLDGSQGDSTGAEELWWGRVDSPGDMNPIENLWRLLKIKVAQKHAKSPDDLRAAIKTVWCTEVSQ